jgi:excinuclease ABC subunit A
MVMAPIVRGRKGEYGKQLEELRGEGFTRAKIDGELRRLDEEIVLDKKFKHDISIVVDRLVMKEDLRKRLADSVETAVTLAGGLVEIELVDGGEIQLYSEKFACPVHGPSLVELEPRIFSFNSPHGACPRCTGLGSQMEIDPELVVPDPTLSIADGAIAPWAASASNYYEQMTEAIAEMYDVDLDTPWEELTDVQRDAFLYGTGDEPVQVTYKNRFGRRRSYASRFEGVVKGLQRRYRETDSEWTREKIEEYMSLRACPVCGGARLRADRGLLCAVGAEGTGVAGRCGAVRDRPPRGAADPAGDLRAVAVPGERGHRLPVDGPGGGDAVGWRGAAHPPGDPDRLVAGGRALHPRRAVDRAAPAR